MTQAIALARGLPLVALNHLEGHAVSPRLGAELAYPYLLLLVSGGHTQILVVEGVGQYKQLGATIDDAAGECFDKSAKLMGLPYPGGPHVQKYAERCTDHAAALKRFPLPRPLTGRAEPDFSFSGLKTAVRTHVDALPRGDLAVNDVADLCFALQDAICAVIADRCARAVQTYLSQYRPAAPTLVVSGGVAANVGIRAALTALAAKNGMAFAAPPVALCSDNAAMIAWTGVERLRLGMTDALDAAARPRWPLDPAA